jgi:hypothetical protein
MYIQSSKPPKPTPTWGQVNVGRIGATSALV